MAHYLASYKTGFVQANGRERIAIGFVRTGNGERLTQRLFSIVPHLNGNNIPTLRDAYAIARGESVAAACEAFNAEQDEREHAAYVAMLERAARDSEFWQNRNAMIALNQARAAYLRSRQWSDKALETLAWHAFALAMDRDGDAVVRAAVKRYANWSMCRHSIASGLWTPRDAWHVAYAESRQRAYASRRIRGRA
jgi:predicted acyl esterase